MDRGSITVLIIEDNSGDARLLREYLTESSNIQFSLLFADSLSAANKYLSQESLDVIILDLGLPDSQGTETFTKTEQMSPGVPIVILTGLGDMNTARRIMQMGAQDYLVKGDINPSLIQRTIQYAIERQQYQLSLKSSEERQRILIRENADGIIVVDQKKVVHFVNPAAESILGKSAGDLVGKSCQLPLDNNSVDALEIDLPGKKGMIYAEIRSAGIDWDGQKMQLITLRDVSERIQAELRIKESEVKYQTLYNSIRDAIIVTDTKRKIINCNDAFSELFGYSREEIIGQKSFLIYENKEIFNVMGKTLNQHAEDGTILSEIKYRKKDGSTFPGEVSVNQFKDKNGDVIGFIGIIHDITIRVQAEEKIRKSEAELKKAQSFAHIGSWMWDINTNRLHWSDEMYNLFGIKKEKFSGQLQDVIKKAIHPDDRLAVDASNKSVIENGKPIPIEYRIILPNNSIRWVWAEAGELEYDEEGNPALLRGTVQDITERKKAEDILRLWETIFKEAAWGVAVGNKDGNTFNLVNPAYAEMHGLTVEEIIGMPVVDVFAPEARDSVADHIKVAHEKGHHTYESVHIRKDGSRFPVQVDVSTVRNEKGEIEYRVVNVMDITERKRMQQALVDSEKKYRTYIEHSPVGIYIIDSDGNYQDVNRAACEQTGYTKEELLDLNVRDLLPPDYMGNGLELFSSLKEKGFLSYEICLKRKDDSVFPIILDAVKLSDDIYMAYCTDIADREAALQALRERDQLLNKIFDILPVGLWIADKDGKLIRSNLAGRKIWGAEPLVGQEEYNVFKARRLPSGEEIPPEDWALVHTINEGITVRDEVLEIDGFDGMTRTILNYTAPVLDDQEKVQNAVIVNLDISDLKEAEKSLQQSEEKYRTLFENMPVGIFRLGPDHSIIEANKALAEIAGYQSTDELKTRKSLEFYSETFQREKLVEEMVAKGELNNKEILLRNKDGDLVDILVSARLNFLADGNLESVEGTLTDITEFKRTSRALDRRDEEIRQLYEAGKLLNESLDLDVLYDNLQGFISQVVPSDRLSIASYDRNRDTIQIIRLWQGGVPLDIGDYFKLPLEEWHNETQRKVIRSGQAQIENREIEAFSSADQTMDDRILDEYIASKPFQSAVFVPIKIKDDVVGVLGLLSYLKNAFSEDDMRFLESLCHQVGVAISNAMLYKQTQNRVKQLSSLHSIDKAISSSFSLDISLDILINALIEHLGVDAADILLFKPYTQTLEFYRGKGFNTFALQHTNLRLGEGYAGKIALSRKRMIIADISDQPGELIKSDELMVEGFVTYIGVPLVAKGKLKGVIEIFHRAPLVVDDDWLEFLDTLAGQAAIAIDNYELFNDLQYSNLNLSMAYDETIEGWSQALDLRDHETEGHTQRVTDMTLKLARKMGVSEDQMVHIKRGSLLHDIGKMGVSDTILLKPGPLNDEEWDIMRQHPKFAYNMLSNIAFLEPALEIPYCHHERWDGNGYPRGLKGEQIPLSARIFAVIDVWDALISDRPYRGAWPLEEVVAYIKEQSGSHFDPRVVSAFLELMDGQVP